MWKKGNGNKWQIQALELTTWNKKHFCSKMWCISKSNKTDGRYFRQDINLPMMIWLDHKKWAMIKLLVNIIHIFFSTQPHKQNRKAVSGAENLFTFWLEFFFFFWITCTYNLTTKTNNNDQNIRKEYIKMFFNIEMFGFDYIIKSGICYCLILFLATHMFLFISVVEKTPYFDKKIKYYAFFSLSNNVFLWQTYQKHLWIN